MVDNLRKLIGNQSGVRQDTMKGTVLSVNYDTKTARVRVKQPLLANNYVVRGESTLKEPVFTGASFVYIRSPLGFAIGDYIVLDPGFPTEEYLHITNIQQEGDVGPSPDFLPYTKYKVTLDGPLQYPHSRTSTVLSDRNADKTRVELWDTGTQEFRNLSRVREVGSNGATLDQLEYLVLDNVPINSTNGDTGFAIPGAPVLLGLTRGDRNEITIIGPATTIQNPLNRPKKPSIFKGTGSQGIHVRVVPNRANGVFNPRDKVTGEHVPPEKVLHAESRTIVIDFEIYGEKEVLEKIEAATGYKWRVFLVDQHNTGSVSLNNTTDMFGTPWGYKLYTSEKHPLNMKAIEIKQASQGGVSTTSIVGNVVEGLYVNTKRTFTVELYVRGPEATPPGTGQSMPIVGVYVCTANSADNSPDPNLDNRAFVRFAFDENIDGPNDIRAHFSPIVSGNVVDVENEDHNWKPEFWQIGTGDDFGRPAISNAAGGTVQLAISERDYRGAVQAGDFNVGREKRTTPTGLTPNHFDYIYIYAEKLSVGDWNTDGLNGDNAGGSFRHDNEAMYNMNDDCLPLPVTGNDLVYANMWNNGDAGSGQFWLANFPLTVGQSTGPYTISFGAYKIDLEINYVSASRIDVIVHKGIYDDSQPEPNTVDHGALIVRPIKVYTNNGRTRLWNGNQAIIKLSP